MILPGKMSNNRGVEKSNFPEEERHLVSFLVPVGSDHSVVKAPQNGVLFLHACAPANNSKEDGARHTEGPERPEEALVHDLYCVS